MSNSLRKYEIFIKKIDELEMIYWFYFKDRKSSFTNERDKISNHFEINHNNIDWQSTHDLHFIIKRQVQNIFGELYK